MEGADLARSVEPDGFTTYVSPSLTALGVPHAFTTRRGPGERELDLAQLDRATRERIAQAAGAPGARVARMRQVHGSGVRVVQGSEPVSPPDADALVTDTPGRMLLVRTADCVPVLVAIAGGERVAAIHAGWRGLVAGVIPRALAALGTLEGEAVAAVGPCLSPRRFEVGPEVARAFVRAGLGAVVLTKADGRPHVDLREAARLQLERHGLRRIDGTDRCTWEDADEFFSHRRDVTHGPGTTTGRTGAVIGVALRADAAVRSALEARG